MEWYFPFTMLPAPSHPSFQCYTSLPSAGNVPSPITDAGPLDDMDHQPPDVPTAKEAQLLLGHYQPLDASTAEDLQLLYGQESQSQCNELLALCQEDLYQEMAQSPHQSYYAELDAQLQGALASLGQMGYTPSNSLGDVFLNQALSVFHLLDNPPN